MKRQDLLENIRDYSVNEIVEAIRSGVVSFYDLRKYTNGQFSPLMQKKVRELLQTGEEIEASPSAVNAVTSPPAMSPPIPQPAPASNFEPAPRNEPEKNAWIPEVKIPDDERLWHVEEASGDEQISVVPTQSDAPSSDFPFPPPPPPPPPPLSDFPASSSEYVGSTPPPPPSDFSAPSSEQVGLTPPPPPPPPPSGFPPPPPPPPPPTAGVRCPKCGFYLSPEATQCPSCGMRFNDYGSGDASNEIPQSNGYPSQGPKADNQSKDTPKLNSFSWGGFLLSWLWGIFNGVYSSLLSLAGSIIVTLGLILLFATDPGMLKEILLWCMVGGGALMKIGTHIVLGVSGKEFAWKSKKHLGVERFEKKQMGWNIAAIIIFILSASGAALYYFLFIA